MADDSDSFAKAIGLNQPNAGADTAKGLEDRLEKLQDDILQRRFVSLKNPNSAAKPTVTDDDLRQRFEKLMGPNKSPSLSSVPTKRTVADDEVECFLQQVAASVDLQQGNLHPASPSIQQRSAQPQQPLAQPPMTVEALMANLSTSSTVPSSGLDFDDEAGEAVLQVLDAVKLKDTHQQQLKLATTADIPKMKKSSKSLDDVIAQVLSSKSDSDSDEEIENSQEEDSGASDDSDDSFDDKRRRRNHPKPSGKFTKRKAKP